MKDVRVAYAATIVVVVFHLAMIDVVKASCDQEECDAECKYRLHKDYGYCKQNAFYSVEHISCYCAVNGASYGTITDISWCNRDSPDTRCVPMVDPNSVHCNPDDCWGLCRSQYEGWNWKDVRGACEPYYCKCYGKGNHWWSSDNEEPLN